MSTDTASIAPDCTTDAGFRTWGSRISQAMSTCGLVQTADTGQINWATIVRGGGVGAENISGYEIWRFNDSLQATAPVFIKIEYGFVWLYDAGYYNQNMIAFACIYITVGSGTNGAGTLTGVVSTRTRVCGMTTPNVNTQGAGSTTGASVPGVATMYAAGNGSYINFVWGAQAAAQPYHGVYHSSGQYAPFPCMFGVERTRDSDGTPNNAGLLLVTNNWNAGTWYSGVPTNPSPTFQILNWTGGAQAVLAQEGYWPFACPGNLFSTSNVAGNQYYFPLPVATPVPQAQALGWLSMFKNDIALGVPQTITVLGQPHTYLSLAGIAGTANNDNTRSRYWSQIVNGALMMRYE